MEHPVVRIYKCLLVLYGPQGWWPLIGVKGINPTKSGSMQGYHPGDYSYPRTEPQRFEICIGAILTQNTAWSNVERALRELDAAGLLSPEAILRADDSSLLPAIRSAGYFNQKAKKLRIFSAFWKETGGKPPARRDLLSLWGVGPETADSILLYAYGLPEFVVDAYTKRILGGLDIIEEQASYDDIKDVFEKALGKDTRVFQEYHALLVEHAKRHYQKKPFGQGDPLRELIGR